MKCGAIISGDWLVKQQQQSIFNILLLQQLQAPKEPLNKSDLSDICSRLHKTRATFIKQTSTIQCTLLVPELPPYQYILLIYFGEDETYPNVAKSFIVTIKLILIVLSLLITRVTDLPSPLVTILLS